MSDDFQLFTTLRIEEGRCNLLSLHLDRLAESARTLGFRFDREELQLVLTGAARRERGKPPSRLRVTLSADGSSVVGAAVPLLPDAPHLQAMLWPDPVDSSDPFFQHKTTRRPVYDSVIREVHNVGFIDAIFQNEHGLVTEGAVHSIFVRHGTIWRAPSLNAGVLPGVYRSHLLETMPGIREEDFNIAQLLSADEVWLTNAVRGIRKVTVVRDV